MAYIPENCKEHRMTIYAREIIPHKRAVSNNSYNRARIHTGDCKWCGIWYEVIQKNKERLIPKKSKLEKVSKKRA